MKTYEYVRFRGTGQFRGNPAPGARGRARRLGERLHLAEAVDVVAQERSVLLDDHHRHLVEADWGVGVVVAVAGEPRRRQRLAQPARPVGLGEAVRPDPDRGVDEDPVPSSSTATRSIPPMPSGPCQASSTIS